MLIKNVIIDNIDYINFITFDISFFFFIDLPCWNWGASYTPVRLTCRKIQQMSVPRTDAL